MPYRLDINIYSKFMLFKIITKYFKTKKDLINFKNNYKNDIIGTYVKFQEKFFTFEKQKEPENGRNKNSGYCSTNNK